MISYRVKWCHCRKGHANGIDSFQLQFGIVGFASMDVYPSTGQKLGKSPGDV